MTRNGKIARLPRNIRDELNRRLQDGEPGKSIAEWLNSDERVEEVLIRLFEGRPINEQNLSEWKQGGYRDWERHQNSLALVQRLAEQADDYDEAANGAPVSHVLANAMAMELAQAFEAVIQESDEPGQKLKQLKRLLPHLAELRREDRKAVSAMIERARWEHEEAQRDEKASKKRLDEMKRTITDPIWASLQLPFVAQAFGGGEYGWEVAFHLQEVQNDLPKGYFAKRLGQPAELARAQSKNQSESNQIKPDIDSRAPEEPTPVRDSPA